MNSKENLKNIIKNWLMGRYGLTYKNLALYANVSESVLNDFCENDKMPSSVDILKNISEFVATTFTWTIKISCVYNKCKLNMY